MNARAPIVLSFMLLCSVANGEQDWNQFRGPHGDGISAAKDLPLQFDEAMNVRWKIAIAGQGWSSPVVWGKEVWLTTGSDERKELRAVCVDLDSGKVLKNIKVFEMIQRKVVSAYKHDSPHLNSPATPTPVVEADRVFVHFGSQGIACLDRSTGRKIWERRDLQVYQPVRQGSSPIVDDESLYVAYDGTDQQFFVALNKNTGETRWKKNRNIETDYSATLRARGLQPKKDGGGKPGDNKKSFATASLIEVGGVRQLIAPAGEATIAYNPKTGEEIWRVLHPGGFNVAARPLYANGMVYVFTSGLTGHLLAIKANGAGDVTDTHVAWSTTKSTPHIPSPVILNNLFFMVTSRGGIARCLDARSGREYWKKRLGGDHWASPIYANGKLYFCSKQGDVRVLPATQDEPEFAAENKLNASFIASPATAGSSLILRSTTHLYCLAKGHRRNAQQVAADVYPNSPNDDRSAAAPKPKNLQAYAAKLKESVRNGTMTKADAIAAYAKAAASQGFQKGVQPTNAKRKVKRGARPGGVNYYSIVIGRLRTKDIELGEFVLDVDYAISDNSRINEAIVGKRIKLVGVAGQFLDNLLQIKRGDTLKVRTGDFNPKTNELGFGYKFQVLERTSPFKPEDFGVPPKQFRGFRGELVGKVVEAIGYEVLLLVGEVRAGGGNEAATPSSAKGKRIRIVGFYSRHADKFADLHEGDTIRLSVRHDNPDKDSLQVTEVFKKEVR